MSKIKLHTDDYIFTSRQRSCGKVMSSDVSVCNSVHRGWGPYTGPLVQPSQTYLNLFDLDFNVQGPFDMFKRVHNETRTLGEWAVNI